MFMGTGNRKSAVLDAENRRTQSVSPAVSLIHTPDNWTMANVDTGGIYIDRETIWCFEETARECEQRAVPDRGYIVISMGATKVGREAEAHV